MKVWNGDSMELFFILFSLWLISTGLKSLTRIPKASRIATQSKPKSTCLTALTALQDQRELIQDMISDIDNELDNVPPEKRRYQLQTRKQQLLNKLASVESKIDKLIK